MRALCLSTLILCGTAAFAAETQTYTYDARGRLKQVAHSGTVNNGVNTAYTLDKADNRTNQTTTGAGPALPSFSVNDVTITEGGTLSFTVSKSGTATGNVSVDYATANGTAAAGSDYTATSGTLTFTPTDTALTVNVATIDDAAPENSETLFLNLSNPVGATISDNQGKGTITDNEPVNQPPVTVADAATVSPHCTFSHDVISNDSDPENNLPLVLQSVTGGNGSGTVSGNSVTYTTGANNFTAPLTYTVADSLGATSTGTYTVTTKTSGATCP